MIVNSLQSLERVFDEAPHPTVASLFRQACDLLLVIDNEGEILDCHITKELSGNMPPLGVVGRNWSSLVTVESRLKIQEMIASALKHGEARWRQINFMSEIEDDIPMTFKVQALGCSDQLLAFGRDLSRLTNVQQNLVQAQLTLERETARLRSSDTRYKVLFRSVGEAVVIVDPMTETVVEANDAAEVVLKRSERKLINRKLGEVFADFHAALVSDLVAKAKVADKRDFSDILTSDDGSRHIVSVRYVPQHPDSFILIRISPADIAAWSTKSNGHLLADSFLDAMPDGIVITDKDGRIFQANSAFQTIAQLSSEDAAIGQSIEKWVGRTSVDFSVMMANLRKYGYLRNFATSVRDELGIETNVEISAAAMKGSASGSFAFVFRNIDQRIVASKNTETIGKTSEQMVELIGKLSLKQIVRQTTDEIERLCIESALTITGDNRASAAELLGLSRQSFYVKMRRFGLSAK